MLRLTLFLAVPALVIAQAAAPDGPRGGGTKFNKCGGLFGVGGADRCHDVVISKLQVQIGAQGTNEDVSVKICSDDLKTCCETGVLDKSFSDDWSRNSLETWKKSDLGGCKDKVLTIKSGLSLTLNKKGSTVLGVTSLFVEAEATSIPNPAERKQTKEPERFACGKYTVNKSTPSKTNFCKTEPYEYERVKSVNVTIGPDGTDDTVKVELCSNVNSVCCKVPLSSTFVDNWSRGDTEIWKENDLGACKTMLYKINGVGGGGPKFALSKNGKDNLVVNKIIVETEGAYGNKYRYDCGGFRLESVNGPCVEGVSCRQERVCKKSILGSTTVGGSPTRRPSSPTRRPSSPTRRPSSPTRRPASPTRRPSIGGGASGVAGILSKTTTRKPSSVSSEKVKIVNITMGDDGTNDDVKVKVCSNLDKNCCEMKLSSTFSDDFSKNDVEIWKENSFGDCKNILYNIRKTGISNGPTLTLSKPGKDDLKVKKIILETQSKSGSTIKYDCGAFNLVSPVPKKACGAACTKTNNCRDMNPATALLTRTTTRRPSSASRRPNAPTRRPSAGGAKSAEIVKVINITMGDDGTNDDVKVKVCSNLDTYCCEMELSSTFSDDFSKNDVEVWKEKSFGACKNKTYNINKAGTNNGPKLTLSKPGKDDLKVKQIILETEGRFGVITKYDCGEYNLISPVPKKKCGTACTKTNDCRDLSQFPSLPSSLTSRDTTTRRTSGRIATSTRPPFRSGKK